MTCGAVMCNVNIDTIQVSNGLLGQDILCLAARDYLPIAEDYQVTTDTRCQIKIVGRNHHGDSCLV